MLNSEPKNNVCEHCFSPLDEYGLCTAKRELAQKVLLLPTSFTKKYKLNKGGISFFAKIEKKRESYPCRDSSFLSKASIKYESVSYKNDYGIANYKTGLNLDIRVIIYKRKKDAKEWFYLTTYGSDSSRITDNPSVGEGLILNNFGSENMMSFYRKNTFVETWTNSYNFIDRCANCFKVMWDASSIIDNNIMTCL